jgi:hypothetical protein
MAPLTFFYIDTFPGPFDVKGCVLAGAIVVDITSVAVIRGGFDLINGFIFVAVWARFGDC